MRRFILLALVFALLPLSVQARVPREGELTHHFQLKVEDGQPYLYATLRNHTSAPMEFELPVGMRFNGKHEPCLPVMLGQDALFKMGPNEKMTLKLQALSLYIFQHTDGDYQAVTFMPKDELELSARLSEVWSYHYRNQLQEDPFRICQLLVYLHNGADMSQLKSLFSGQEFETAQRLK